MICLSVSAACGRTRPATFCTDTFAKVRTEHARQASRASSHVSVPVFSLSTRCTCHHFVLKLRPTPLWNAKGCPTGKALPHMAASCYDAETPYRRNADADILALSLQARSQCSPHGCHLPFHAHPQCPFIPFQPLFTAFILPPVSIALRIFLANLVPSCLQMARAATVFLREIFLPDLVRERISLDCLAVLPPPLSECKKYPLGMLKGLRTEGNKKSELWHRQLVRTSESNWQNHRFGSVSISLYASAMSGRTPSRRVILCGRSKTQRKRQRNVWHR